MYVHLRYLLRLLLKSRNGMHEPDGKDAATILLLKGSDEHWMHCLSGRMLTM
jgi:hypothetical protein